MGPRSPGRPDPIYHLSYLLLGARHSPLSCLDHFCVSRQAVAGISELLQALRQALGFACAGEPRLPPRLSESIFVSVFHPTTVCLLSMILVSACLSEIMYNFIASND